MTKPNTNCERTVDFMSIYPTLTDLCGIPTPGHNEGVSIRTLLANPSAPWDQAGVTTYRYKNHTARTADWRYIRYANGDEELYDETKDPNEWTNLATKPEFAAKKAELAKFLPKKDVPDPGGKSGKGAEVGDEPEAKKGGKRKK
jgi:arylsulfatase A-like enzyme